MVNEMMFGGNLKEMFQNAVLLNLPEWFVDGAPRYVAKGWNAEMDDYVRQLVRSKKNKQGIQAIGKRCGACRPIDMELYRGKIWQEQYSNILNYTRVIRSEQRSILLTWEFHFKQLVSDWKQYYSQIEKKVVKVMLLPQTPDKFTPSHHKATVYTTI